MIEIPGYTLQRSLGQGGMATVYLAVQQSLEREVALKILSARDRAWTAHDSGITTLLVDPFILRYQHDPRFAAFCKKVGLPTTTEAKALP